ncbi:MAG TPA: hypothetical protein VFJ16_03660 [Longimicrobium sp.]|nr:hypothetical protein [Longimicrobium sp.]
MHGPTLRARTVGELLDTAFQVVRARYAELAFATLVLVSPALVLNFLLADVARPAALLLQTFLLNYVTAAAVVIVSNVYLGRASDPNEVYRRVFSRFWPIFGAAMLQILAIGAGMLLCVVPGIYLAVALFAMPVVVMLENAGPVDAFDRSQKLAGEHWGRIAGSMLLASLLVGIAQFGTGLLFSLARPLSPWMADMAGNVVTVLLAPFPAVVATLMYYDLRIRKEGFDIQALMEAMGPASATETPAPAY